MARKRPDHSDETARCDGLIWVGSAVDDPIAVGRFFSDVLGMEIVDEFSNFVRLTMDNGDRVELFGPESEEHDLDTGPIAGFHVADIVAAHARLLASESPDVTPLHTGPDGHRWFYFRAPDGNFYEICEQARPRQPNAAKG